jgi:hypothetical protein
MEQIALLSFATASIAFGIAETKLLAPLRERTKRRSQLLGELISCGYCLGHWVALGLVAIYRPRLFNAWWLLDYLITALIIAWLAALQWAVLCALVEKAGK